MSPSAESCSSIGWILGLRPRNFCALRFALSQVSKSRPGAPISVQDQAVRDLAARHCLRLLVEFRQRPARVFGDHRIGIPAEIL